MAKGGLEESALLAKGWHRPLPFAPSTYEWLGRCVVASRGVSFEKGLVAAIGGDDSRGGAGADNGTSVQQFYDEK